MGFVFFPDRAFIYRGRSPRGVVRRGCKKQEVYSLGLSCAARSRGCPSWTRSRSRRYSANTQHTRPSAHSNCSKNTNFQTSRRIKVDFCRNPTVPTLRDRFVKCHIFRKLNYVLINERLLFYGWQVAKKSSQPFNNNKSRVKIHTRK